MTTLIHNEQVNGTPSSGTYVVNTAVTVQGMLRQVIIEPASSSTIYDIKIENNKGHTIYERLSETGPLAESVDIPVKGVLTFTITNATVDEVFTAQLAVQNQ